MYRKVTKAVEKNIERKKHLIYGGICGGFCLMSLNYFGVIPVFAGPELYSMIKPVIPSFETAIMNIDEAMLIVDGMGDIYKAMISVAGSAVYGKKMINHHKKKKDKEDISGIDTKYDNVIRMITEKE